MSLIPYDFDGTPVRTITRDAEPWFVLADVCQVLDIGEAHVASRRLDDEDKDRFSIPTPVAARARWSD